MKTNLVSALLLIVASPAFSHDLSYPCITMTNNTQARLTIENDPNWDDQQLLVNGKILHDLDYDLATAETLSVCGLWSEFGLNLYPNGNFVAITVLNDDGSNLTKLTNIYDTNNSFNYSILKQTPNQLSITINNPSVNSH